MIWSQNYDPLGSPLLSTLMAALPVVVLLGSIGIIGMRIHFAALLGLAAALVIAMGVYRMPMRMAGATALYGAAYGLFPIGWLILNVMFLYYLTVRKGHFEILRNSLARVAPDPRIQVILVAFSFGAFIEGVAGFGAPVAITAAILIQLGFRPLQASGLALIANTAPVAFGSLGIPITSLSQVTGFDVLVLSKMVGRQLPIFSAIIPCWIVLAYSGWRGFKGVWPAAVTAGIAFAMPQFLVSNFHGPWLVDVVSGACSIVAVILLLRVWRPRELWVPNGDGTEAPTPAVAPHYSGREIFQAWLPWLILGVFIFSWGLPRTKAFLNRASDPQIAIPGLDQRVQRVPPVAAMPLKPEKAVFDFNWLAATGTSILFAGILSGVIMGLSLREVCATYLHTLVKIRFSLLTIAGMLAVGYVTKYSGADATMGLALARTGSLYPFFGTMLGWLGVALTGSDTASNILFGSLQKITSQQTGINPVLMCAANSSGGVMGKMIDAQSIVVASTATNWYGHEGKILRFVFIHSIVLAALLGILVCLQAYVYPFLKMVPPQ
jgi:lactate permease